MDRKCPETTERRGSGWRLALCLASLPGMCHSACQQSQPQAKSGEGRVTTTSTLTTLPNFAMERLQLSKRKEEDKDAKEQRMIS